MGFAIALPILRYWPQGFSGRFDGIAVVVGAGALLALFRYKAGIISVIVVCGVAGLLFLLLKPWLIQQGIFL